MCAALLIILQEQSNEKITARRFDWSVSGKIQTADLELPTTKQACEKIMQKMQQ